jgi:hypothetical protein
VALQIILRHKLDRKLQPIQNLCCASKKGLVSHKHKTLQPARPAFDTKKKIACTLRRCLRSFFQSSYNFSVMTRKKSSNHTTGSELFQPVRMTRSKAAAMAKPSTCTSTDNTTFSKSLPPDLSTNIIPLEMAKPPIPSTPTKRKHIKLEYDDVAPVKQEPSNVRSHQATHVNVEHDPLPPSTPESSPPKKLWESLERVKTDPSIFNTPTKKETLNDENTSPATPTRPKKKSKKESPVKSLSSHPPKNWEQVYEAIKKYRMSEIAPVDEVGCGWLASRDVSPEVRFLTRLFNR